MYTEKLTLRGHGSIRAWQRLYDSRLRRGRLQRQYQVWRGGTSCEELRSGVWRRQRINRLVEYIGNRLDLQKLSKPHLPIMQTHRNFVASGYRQRATVVRILASYRQTFI